MNIMIEIMMMVGVTIMMIIMRMMLMMMLMMTMMMVGQEEEKECKHFECFHQGTASQSITFDHNDDRDDYYGD